MTKWKRYSIWMTDYPILYFGDKAGKEAPMRPCIVDKYDGNKYVHVIVYELGTTRTSSETIKSGYLYNTTRENNDK